MTTIDLSQLTPPDIIETVEFETLLAERKARFVSLYPLEQQADIAATLELESEPINKWMQVESYRDLVLRARYNDEARALLLAFAKGADLDHIGITYYDEARLLITPEDLDAIPPVLAVYEGDDDYRERLQLKPDSYSCAGPTNAYIFFARSADGDVKDASCISPTPGTSLITVLSRTGDGTADTDLLDAVTAALSGDEVRPLCEEVLVQSADIIDYAIDIDITVLPGPDAGIVLAQSIAAVDVYRERARKLGFDITTSGLIAAAHRPGVQKTVINLPTADIVLTKEQAGHCTARTITMAGVDE